MSVLRTAMAIAVCLFGSTTWSEDVGRPRLGAAVPLEAVPAVDMAQVSGVAIGGIRDTAAGRQRLQSQLPADEMRYRHGDNAPRFVRQAQHGFESSRFIGPWVPPGHWVSPLALEEELAASGPLPPLFQGQQPLMEFGRDGWLMFDGRQGANPGPTAEKWDGIFRSGILITR